MPFELPWFQIIIVSVVAWMIGALWFSPALFGKQWMKIHHEKIPSDAEMKEMSKGMMKLMVLELVATFLMVVGLACIIAAIPEMNGVRAGFMVWLGFLLPMTVSNVIWGNDKKKVMFPKIALSSAYRLVIMLLAGYILGGW